MKIAQVAPLYEAVPPKMYGGTERIVSYLTDELVERGHDVTLFASGDSVTKAKLIPGSKKALRLDNSVVDPIALHYNMLQQVVDMADEFDFIHFHLDYLHFPLSRLMKWPQLTTLHGRLDMPDLQPLYTTYSDMPVVSISRNQRLPLPQANFVKTIYHGLPKNLLTKGEGKGGYAAFIGRISPEKRVDRAIEIAEKAGMNIKIAAKIDKVDQEYFDREIAELFEKPHVEFIGEINEQEKNAFLGNAAALLFPIDWPEPFGMVMIEAMATGTPVIAWENGSVPEVIDSNETGMIVNSIDEAVECLKNIDSFDRNRVRKVFDKKYTTQVMAANYEKIYKEILEQHNQTSAAKQVRLTKRVS
jgi:glycosyltransferase involved in cell wall biosynthesis